MTIWPLLAAIVSSVTVLAWLWHGDPKRRRVAKLPAIATDATIRRLGAAAALLPGVILAAAGDSAAFLVWLGSCAIGGWLVAQVQVRKDV